jgi:outer membrane receptor protein involved in Fe transport
MAADDARGSIVGSVTIDSDGPAAGANVVLLDTKIGAAVENDGTFRISGVPVGSYRILARLVGYVQEDPVAITVTEGRESRIRLILRPSAVELNPVIVTGSRRQFADDVRTSVTTITPRESKILPGAAEDVLRSLQALPGVTSVSDFSSQLVVRGSGPDQNLILIDDFEVLNPYRLYGFVSMFNPETVSDISLQTGGFAAQYGDRLSAVLDVRNREGRSDVPLGARINASLTNMNLIAEGRLPLTGGSYLISARRTYYDLIMGPILKSMKLVEGDVALPNFRDLQGRLSIPLGNSHKVLVNVFTSRDGVQLISGAERNRPDSVSLFDVSYNTLAGVTWQFNPTKGFVSQTRVSWYRNDGRGQFDGTFVDPSQNTGDLARADTFGIRFYKFGLDYDFIYEKFSVGQEILWNVGAHSVEAGFGFDRLRTDFVRFFELDELLKSYLRSRGIAVPTDVVESIWSTRFNLYLQDRMALGERLFVQPGIRVDVSPVLRTTTYVSPRINVSWKVDNRSTLRAAYGLYYQSPGMEKLDMQSRIVYTREAIEDLVAERAQHWVLGYDRMISPEWQFKVEGYVKDFRDIIRQQKLAGTLWQVERTSGSIFSRDGWTIPVGVAGDSLTMMPVNAGTGKSYGFEVMFQKIQSLPGEVFTGWISYALSFAERERDGIRTPFLFDQRHAMNIVANYRFAERWDLGARFTLRSGRPYVRALGVKPRVVNQRVNGIDVPVVQIDTQGKVVLDVEYERQTLTGRLDLYHTMDLRITTYPSWWDLQWSIYLDIQNVYNHKNQQMTRYFVDDKGELEQRHVYGIPIFPSLGLSLAF